MVLTRSLAVFGMAVRIDLVAVILVEVTGRMVLLIPKAIRKLKAEGRQEQNERLAEAFQRFGIVVDGVPALPITPEVKAFLFGNDSKR